MMIEVRPSTIRFRASRTERGEADVLKGGRLQTVRLTQLTRSGVDRRVRPAQEPASGKLGGKPASSEVPVPLQSGERYVERLRGLGLR